MLRPEASAALCEASSSKSAKQWDTLIAAPLSAVFTRRLWLTYKSKREKRFFTSRESRSALDRVSVQENL
jgi:hypothetical protein